MRKAIILGALLGILLIALLLWIFPLGSPQAMQTNIVQPNLSDPTPQVLVENLDTPWAIAFLPDESMIFTQRAGKVQLLHNNDLRTLGDINVNEESESGLHGIAVDPDFEKNKFIYVYYTHDTGNRVSRFTLDGMLKDEKILLDNIPNARFHDGGRIKFGPDGLLYITTGDATTPSTAQDKNSLAGKILRMNKDGSIPEDNPFKNYVYSMGHRNPQGITWDDEGVMYASEHGPTMHDEINIIRKGGNYGWPDVCKTNPAAVDPIRCYTEFTLAPAGIAFDNGTLYVAGLRGTQLRALTVENGTITQEKVMIDNLGRIREVTVHGDYLYIATSNRDGRGVPAPSDDKIIRLPR
jgi:aldose sugar dehydrogenase